MTTTKELMKGCGKKYLDWFCRGETVQIRSADSRGSVRFNQRYFCPTCKVKISERLNCYKEELEFLEKCFNGLGHKPHPVLNKCAYDMDKRISFLKAEIQDLTQ